jgi:hypothetical protein
MTGKEHQKRRSSLFGYDGRYYYIISEHQEKATGFKVCYIVRKFHFRLGTENTMATHETFTKTEQVNGRDLKTNG